MHTITLPLTSINLTKVGLAAVALALLIYFAVDYGFIAMAQSSGIELASTSIDGGGGTMSGGSLSLEYSIAQSQPVGSGSSASYSLESGFMPVIAQQNSLTTVSPTATPVPALLTPTPTPTPTVTSAPGISGWGLVALATGMLAVMSVALRFNSGRRQSVKP